MLYPRIENEHGAGPWSALADARYGYLSAHDSTWQDGIPDPPIGWLHAWKLTEGWKKKDFM